MENSNVLVKSAVMATVVIILLATLLSPVITDAAYNHVVQSNDGATDGVDLGYYTPKEGKTSVEVYPDTVTVTADNGTVTIAYPATTKTITGDAILAIGGGSATSAKDLNLYVKNGKLYNSGVEYSSCTIKCVDNINQGSLYIDFVLTGAKTVYLMPLVDWAYLPTLGGTYGSYTGDLAYTLSDVVSIGDFAGAYIASKGTDIISNNEYDLSATIERDADGNVTGVKYAKATAEAAAVDGSASMYTGEDPVIIAPDDDSIAVVTPEEWDGEDAAALTASTQTVVGDCYYTTLSTSAIVTGPADSTATSITIPETVSINGTSYTVTSIGTYAFDGDTALTTINLPSSILYIQPNAFSGCTSLALTSLPSGITSIAHDAFSGCTSLALTSLPEQLTSIEENAFYDCPLTDLVLQSSPSISTNALPATLTEVLNLGSTTLTTTMGIGDNTIVSDSIKSLAIVQQKNVDYYEEKGSEYTLLLIIPILVIVALLYALISTYRKMQS